MRQMKIAFESAVLDDNNMGLETYARNLLESFSAMNKLDQIYTIHYKPQADNFYADKNEVLVPHYPFYLSKVFGIPAAIKKCNPDLVHFPVHRCDDFLSYFFNRNIKKVLTIHDLIPFFYNDKQGFQMTHLWMPMLRIAHAHNVRIITVSENTRKDCEKYLHIPKEKIRVIHPGADPLFVPRKDKDTVKERVRVKTGISGPFIFYTGSLLPRKNIRRLIEAFILIKRKNYPHKLVIGGNPKSCFEDVKEIINQEIIQKDVLFTGYLKKDDLVDMYNAADLFVYPSLYEGFGSPPLEAMACGTPVVVSNTSSLPEVVGDAGKLIDPYNTKDLADAIEELILDEGYRDELSRKGFARSQLFTWERAGKETWKVYEEIVKKEGTGDLD
ncbi:glycosyltransferase family 4 protein [Methanoregula sp.]|uniref:glycosyltransferase family 4 protein n=1 Tax=Methanoregula sp. TaxID=2052170 RepID=UPI003C7182EC